MKNKNVIIVGDSSFAEIANLYINRLDDCNVIYHAVEKDFIVKKNILNTEIKPLEEVLITADKSLYFFVAIPYTNLNRLRTRLYNLMLSNGFKPFTYISPDAIVDPSSVIGDHCFIFENNNIQPFVNVHDNCILWSGNHIGHHSIIKSNCFISSHVVISGHCDIGKNCFIGVNAFLSNNVLIGEDNWIYPGSNVSKDTPDNTIVQSPKSEFARISARKFFKVI